MELKNAIRAEDIPDVDHYAIITNNGDKLLYSVYKDRRAWEKAIERTVARGLVYRAMHVNAARVSTRIDITVMDRPISSGRGGLMRGAPAVSFLWVIPLIPPILAIHYGLKLKAWLGRKLR